MSPYLYQVLSYLAIVSSITGVVAQDWTDAHATFYGDGSGGETRLGACGYDVFKDGYGLATTALSTALFNDGAKCGTCYEIKCVNSQWCLGGSIQVTATNFCPPSGGPQAWCNPPAQHFDLSEPMFVKIAQYKAGIVPVQYRRIPCVRQGGIKFQIAGNPNFLLVLVYNVAGAGDVTGMRVKGPNSDWVQMSRNWGMNWQASGLYNGQPLSFQLMASDGKVLELDNVVPQGWQFGQTFEGGSNF